MDEWGVVWRRNAYYYDMVDFPIKGQITHADLEVFPFPNARDPGRIRGLAERAKEAQDSGKAVTLDPLAGGILEMANSLRGHQSFFTDMAANPDLAMYLLDRITGFFEDFYEQALTSAGEYVDVVFFGDDYGMQSGMLISPRMWRKMIKPFLARLIQKIKNTAPVRFQLHSCGAVFPIIEDLVEIGVDILNPLQPSAVGMDLPMIKKKFGDRLVFHGVIDQQEVLPHGTIEEVENEVRSRLGILAPGGGYVVAVSPNIQADVRPQNILALFDSIRKWGSYPIHVV
jgi:uroporphyrinogen decarboxylase